MASGPAKRSSDDSVFSDTKKKKITKEKRDPDVLKEKTPTTVNNGDLKQKKAFFAYFGKKFNEDNLKVNGNIVDATKKSVAKHDTLFKHTENNDDHMQILLDKETEEIIEENVDISRPTSNCIIKKNENLPYTSNFVEKLGFFPKITHANWLAPLGVSNLNLCLTKEILHDYNIKNLMFSFQTPNSVSKRLVLNPYQMEIHLPSMISSFKKSIPTFPVLDFQKHLKQKYLSAKKSKTDIECMWINKYKPMCTQEVLGNSELIKGLKNWLNPMSKKSNKLKKAQKYDDDDDFIFDSDSNSSYKMQHNLAILLGPSGCGKTSAVYAVANELNANVIELNAACNRSGKRIITDLMEATQSHAVEKNCLINMLKEKKKKPKNTKKKKEDANEKMTIILIEDADIFFENYDDGFLPAISTLASDSKRPLVLTANDPFSNHLLKFILSGKIISNFVYPPKDHLNCFLQLIALNEGVIMSNKEINTFIHPFKPDIRQSMIQLQYVLSTGELNQKKQNCSSKKNINSIWWNWPYIIGCNLNNAENNKRPKCNISIATVSQNLDSMLYLNLIHSKTQSYDFLDPQPFWHHIVKRDSASLVETNHWSDNSVQLSTEIMQWIHNHIDRKDDIDEKPYPSYKQLNERQRMWNTSKDILEQIGLDYCNRKNETYYDYMATIRSLGRKQQLGNLRHSKLFSYLERININIKKEDIKHMCNSLHSSSNCDQPLEISDQF